MSHAGTGRNVARAWIGLRGTLVAFLALGVCTGIAACTGSLFRSRAVPPAIYRLSANLETAAAAPAVSASPPTAALGVAPTPIVTRAMAPPGYGAPAVAADLAVLRPRVRTGLETDRIAVLYPDRHLDYLADVRWSGPLDRVVQDLAVQAFETGAHLRNVSADGSAFASGYWMEIEVADFQAEYSAAGSAPTVHVRMSARLGAAGDRRILGSFDASARESASENRLTAIIDAYERAADAALAQIVASTSRALSENLERR